MTDDARGDRNRTMLQQCHPYFRARLISLLMRMQLLGFRPRIQCAWRSLEDEEAAFQSGRSHLEWGFHNATAPDGTPQALAADVLDDDRPLDPSRRYLISLAHTARQNDLQTGILWNLPNNIRIAVNAAVEANDADYTGLLGFDPTHVEVTRLTVAEARAGQRPAEGTNA